MRGVVAVLRDHRILRTDEAGRWEIFHDVLAGAVLGWKTRYDAARAVQREREEARRRHRRLAFLAFGSLVGLARPPAPGGIRVLTAQRSARPGTRRPERPTRRERALRARDRPGARHRARARGSTARSDAPCRGRAPRSLDASRAAGDHRHRPSGRRDGCRPVGLAPSSSVTTASPGCTTSRRARRGGHTAWTAPLPRSRRRPIGAARRRLVARRVDAETGDQAGSQCPSSLPGTVEELVPSPDGRSAIARPGSRAARVVALATGEPDRSRQALARASRTPRSRHGSPRREQRASTGRRGSGIPDVAGDGRRSSATTARCSRSRSTRGQERRRDGEHRSDGACLVRPASRRFALFGHTGFVGDVAFGPGRRARHREWRRNGEDVEAERRPGAGAPRAQGPVREGRVRVRRTVVTAGADGTLRIWDPGTSIELVRASNAPGRALRDAMSAADGSATRRESKASSSACARRRASRSLEGHRDVVNTRRVQPGRAAARDRGAGPRRHRLGRLDRSRSVRLDEAQSASVTDARFSPDGRWLVTAGPMSARLWNPTGVRCRYLYGPKSPLTAVAFEPDSRDVVTREEAASSDATSASSAAGSTS